MDKPSTVCCPSRAQFFFYENSPVFIHMFTEKSVIDIFYISICFPIFSPPSTVQVYQHRMFLGYLFVLLQSILFHLSVNNLPDKVASHQPEHLTFAWSRPTNLGKLLNHVWCLKHHSLPNYSTLVWTLWTFFVLKFQSMTLLQEKKSNLWNTWIHHVPGAAFLV